MIEVINTVICYNNSYEVLEYTKQVSKLVDSDKIALVIVVNRLDNGSIEELKMRLSEIGIMTHVVDPKTNLGYMNGMLAGVRSYCEQYNSGSIKYVIMSNTDITYTDRDFLHELLIKSYSDEIWCIGPAVYVPERKNYDNPICEERRTIKEVKQIIRRFRIPIFNELYFRMSNIKGKIIKQKRGSSHKVYELHGCFFIVRLQLAELMINNPFGALLYSEEAYVAENVWHNGKYAFYDSELLIEHNEHAVTGKLNYKKLSKYIADSMEVVLMDYYQEDVGEK